MTRTGWILLAAAVLALAGLYLWARPAPQPMPAPPSVGSIAPTGPNPVPVIAATAATGDFAFEIAGGKVRGPMALVAREGQQVTLRVRSDVADELHVHGYDLTAPLPAGEEVALNFIAARAGRFAIELHHSHREIGALEVQP
jgi:hypothetical protein